MDTDLELVELEGLLEIEHCADQHRFPDNRRCDHEVIAHLTCLCGHAVDSPRCGSSQIWHAMVRDYVTCAGCGNLGRDCWTWGP